MLPFGAIQFDFLPILQVFCHYGLGERASLLNMGDLDSIVLHQTTNANSFRNQPGPFYLARLT